MEETLHLVIEKDDITFGVLKIVWYLTFRDFTSLTFASLLAEHPECLVSPAQPPGTQVLGAGSRNRMQCHTSLWCLSSYQSYQKMATKVGGGFPSECILLLLLSPTPIHPRPSSHAQSYVVFLPLRVSTNYL